jgi:pyrimidine operon attenuation protein / uracil phosphoribosyltransferase
VCRRAAEESIVPVVMDADRMGRTLTRIAHEVVERNRGVEELALVGIRTRGVPLARRLAREVRQITGSEVPTGSLDITLYRDDLMRQPVGPQPLVRRTEIPFSIDDRKILLVDDVLYTGRTIRAALDALIDFGRPRGIQLVVLIDRGHRELPIKADYVGKNLPTSLQQSVQVRLLEVDGEDEVQVTEPAAAPAPGAGSQTPPTPPRRPPPRPGRPPPRRRCARRICWASPT